MLLLSSISIGLTVTFLFMSHPLSILSIIISQTIIMALMAGLVNITYWFSFILFLIFLGGMLVLFVYIASLASNEIFIKMSIPKYMKMFLIPTFIFMIIMLQSNSLYHPTPPQNSDLMLLVNKFYIHNFIFTTLLIIFLLITLFAVVHITKFNEGPLRSAK